MKRAGLAEAELRVRPHDAFERGQVLELEAGGTPLLVRVREIRRLATGSGLIGVRQLGPLELRWYRARQWIGRRWRGAARWIREAIGG